MKLRRLILRFRGQEQFDVDFIGRRRVWGVVSGTLIALSLLGIVVLGFNFGIDFRGGAQLTFPNPAGLSADEVRRTLADLGHEEAMVQLVAEDTAVSVRTAPLGGERTRIVAGIAEAAGVQPVQVNVEEVGPRWGRQISVKALQGFLIFLVVATIYISFRFEWKMSVGALTALFHDLVITAGIYALVGREVTPETVIAILTILGYSLYDTVVIYDKIQENTEQLSLVQRETYGGAVNVSLNQVMMRSVNTSLTSLLPIGALLLFGGETLKNFAFALFVGMGVGTYSSLFVAAPVLTLLKEREPRLQQIRARAELRRRPGLRAVQEPEMAEVVPAEAPPAHPEDAPEAEATPPRPAARKSTTPRRPPAPRKPRKKRSRAQRKKKRRR